MINSTAAESPSAANDIPPLASRRPNRLGISHILLWMATTGAVLAHLQRHQPPPPERIGFASILYQPGEDVEAKKAKIRQQIWQVWQARHFVGLAGAPVYGAALAGLALASWRVVTRRFGFPVQPGHWLMIVIAALYVILMNQSSWRASRVGLTPGWSLAVMMAVFGGAAMRLGEANWRIAFAFASVGSEIALLSLLFETFDAGYGWPVLLMIGLTVATGTFVVALIIAFLCAVHDITQPARFDTFHWVGIAAFFGVGLHMFSLIVIPRVLGY
jgi:hypothetical protein